MKNNNILKRSVDVMYNPNSIPCTFSADLYRALHAYHLKRTDISTLTTKTEVKGLFC